MMADFIMALANLIKKQIGSNIKIRPHIRRNYGKDCVLLVYDNGEDAMEIVVYADKIYCTRKCGIAGAYLGCLNFADKLPDPDFDPQTVVDKVIKVLRRQCTPPDGWA
jgi:hypothetical protein